MKGEADRGEFRSTLPLHTTDCVGGRRTNSPGDTAFCPLIISAQDEPSSALSVCVFMSVCLGKVMSLNCEAMATNAFFAEKRMDCNFKLQARTEVNRQYSIFKVL